MRGAIEATRVRGTTVPIQDHLGRTVAEVSGGVLRKMVRGSRHMLRYPVPAWAFDCCVWQAREAGATRIEVLDTESGISR